MTALAEKTAQVLVSSTEALPVAAVKVSEIVASVQEINCFVINNKVIFQAILHKQIFFVDFQGFVRHVAVNIPFSGFVDVPGVQAGAACELFPSVEFLHFTLITPNCVRETAVVSVGVKVKNIPSGGVFFPSTLAPTTVVRFGEPNTFRVTGSPPGSIAAFGGAVSPLNVACPSNISPFGNVFPAGNVVCPSNVLPAGNVGCPSNVLPAGNVVCPSNVLPAGNVVCPSNVLPAGNTVCPFAVSPTNIVSAGNVTCTGTFVATGNDHSTVNGTSAGSSSPKGA